MPAPFDAVLVDLRIQNPDLSDRLIKTNIVKRNPQFAEFAKDPKALGISFTNGIKFFVPKLSPEIGADYWLLIWPWRRDPIFNGADYDWGLVEPGILGGLLKK